MGQTTTSLTGTCGEPDAVKVARPVRESGKGKRTRGKPGHRAPADSHWVDGGATDLENLVLLCRFHHRLIHRSNWSIRMIDGIPWFIPPETIDQARQPRRNILRQ